MKFYISAANTQYKGIWNQFALNINLVLFGDGILKATRLEFLQCRILYLDMKHTPYFATSRKRPIGPYDIQKTTHRNILHQKSNPSIITKTNRAALIYDWAVFF